jgi:ribose transport system substrate-binding protein
VVPPKNKTIWLVAASLGSDYATRAVSAAQESAGKLGWKVHVFDAKYDPTQMLTGVQQAVVAKADGIVLLAIDCPTVKNAIVQAKAADIPIVGIETKECAPALLSHVVTYTGHESFTDQTLDWGAAQAAWVIARTDGQAKIVMDTETDQWTTVLSSQGIRREVAKCAGCKVVGDATFVGTDLGPALQQKIEQALVQHPDANAYIPAYDVVMTQSGGAQALQASGRIKSLAIGGGEGTAAAIDQIRKGTGEQACAGQSVEWEVYSAVDAMIRIFDKVDPNAVDTGNGVQVCDKDHNMPPEGQPYTPPIDFRAAYLKLWGLS